jgi:hypothetical protein
MAANTTFTTGAILTAAQMNNLPFGMVGKVSYATAQTGISTSYVDMTGITVTFTAIAGRQYKFTYQGSYYSSTAANLPAIQFLDGASVISSPMQMYTAGTSAYSTIISGFVLSTLTAGSHTIKCQIKVFNGSGTGNLQNDNSPGILLIEDLGIA